MDTPFRSTEEARAFMSERSPVANMTDEQWRAHYQAELNKTREIVSIFDPHATARLTPLQCEGAIELMTTLFQRLPGLLQDRMAERFQGLADASYLTVDTTDARFPRMVLTEEEVEWWCAMLNAGRVFRQPGTRYGTVHWYAKGDAQSMYGGDDLVPLPAFILEHFDRAERKKAARHTELLQRWRKYGAQRFTETKQRRNGPERHDGWLGSAQ